MGMFKILFKLNFKFNYFLFTNYNAFLMINPKFEYQSKICKQDTELKILHEKKA